MVAEERLGNILKEKGLKISIAESCTGGLISSRITDISGSSEYFEAGFVTYSNRSKTAFIGVPEHIIDTKGAVSEDTARFMAEGVRSVTGVDIGLSVTGIAGPSGGSVEKPVGTVFMALSADEGTFVRRFRFDGERKEIKRQSSDAAIQFLIDYLEGRVS
ncbi:MAG: CinA family protein [Syntrophorhabdaceae bacterium]|nr:CinA family protein [Syntrophorhabdaceae bacterium]